MKLKTLLFVITLTTSTFVLAQLPPRSDTTSTPVPNAGHDYIHAPVETVNPANGSLSIRIGLPVPPSRGFTLPFSIAYDSNGVYFLDGISIGGASGVGWASTAGLLSQGGWSYTVPTMSVGKKTYTVEDEFFKTHTCGLLMNFVFQDANGGRHNMGLSYNQSTQMDVCGLSDFDVATSGQEGSLIATTSDAWSNSLVNAVKVSPSWIKLSSIHRSP